MMAEIDNTDDADADAAGRGQISREEFLRWYLEKGAFWLEKPTFQKMALQVPSMGHRRLPWAVKSFPRTPVYSV
jgi:hypothetical protein